MEYSYLVLLMYSALACFLPLTRWDAERRPPGIKLLEHTPPSRGYDNEPTCGRPLGMRLDADGYLIVCDAYLGLFKINVASKEVHQLLPPNILVDGRRLNLLNDLDIAENGDIFLTDTSVYQRRDFIYDLLDGRGTGRLLRYDPAKNTTEVLLNGLHFANGVQLSRYEDYVLVSETTRARILRYHLKGAKAGQTDIFADNLPALPDNIRRSARGGYWVGSCLARYEGKQFPFDFLSTKPWLRLLVSKLPPHIILPWLRSSAILLELDANGNIVRSLMDLDGQKTPWLSEVHDEAGTLYLGSFRNNFIAKIDTHRIPSSN